MAPYELMTRLFVSQTVFAKLREIIALSNAPARFGQKGKRSRLEKSPTRRTA
jgi:hypothetical protein